jgi:hypothetical protein
MSRTPGPLTLADLDGVVGGSAATTRGTEGDDAIVSGNGRDHILAGTGNDTVIDFGGRDNTIDGGGGNDRIITGAGRDVIFGGWGHDTIESGSGSDKIDATKPGSDVIDAGIGSDAVFWSPFSNNTSVDGGREDRVGSIEFDHLFLVWPSFYAGELGDPVLTYEIDGETRTMTLTAGASFPPSLGHVTPSMSGTITWGSSTMTFTNIEQIHVITEAQHQSYMR